MKYLVTGAAGFIASKVSEFLLDAGHEVVGLDDMNDYYDVRLKEWRLAQLTGHKNAAAFAFHRGDVADRDTLDRLFQDAGPFDGVFNLAARAGVRASIENPWIYNRTNADGTLNVLECCRKHDVPRMILASTSSLYGAHNERPYKEDADTNRPLSPYAASKKAAEAMSASYTHLYGISTPVLRYFTVYGPAGRPDMAPYIFIDRISRGLPITVYGDGSQERDFTYVDDIARGTIATLDVKGHDVFNLGNDQPHKLTTLISTIEEAVGKKAVIEYAPMHRADMYATWANIEKARKVLGWRPQSSLAIGINATAAYHQTMSGEMHH